MKPKIKTACYAAKGRAHEISGQPCQDKVFIKRIRKNCAFAALADGAGSEFLSHIGAYYAVSNLFSIINDSINNHLIDEINLRKKIVTKLQIGFDELAIKHNALRNNFACTLLFVYSKLIKKRTFYIAGHIGDGVIALFNAKESKVLSPPDRGEFSNSTFFLTSDNALSHFRIYKGTLYGDAGFMLMSDGTAESLYRNSDAALAPACAKIFRWADKFSSKKITRLLEKNSNYVFREMTRDDCSIALMRTVGIKHV